TPMGAIAKFAAAGKRAPKKDLGVMAMSYKTAYIAQIAYGANPNQTLRAIREAVDFPGTSLVIAYAPCVEHGYPLNLSSEHMKLAVDTGFWPLYRFDPRRIEQGEAPLQLDSKKPTVDLSELMRQERRFRSLQIYFPEEAEQVLHDARIRVQRDFQYLQALSEVRYNGEGSRHE
ncbi:pyruvate:ferredoxin (flavodoxin) oxidoreductase, partial [bacterium]|nr:pyruvate:ferredoxin (flavodoxin) oxidoreductase [bacterium]